ncbi:hypothetical protein MYCTH_2109081 [Thermothelomyces thermophilus ATCC 42464]|uniref:Uncharacterized protein n=1 Tax=Thermothelomyces thermophilus (strain ATCC 42464 / BCRC 31852 / DSM 1799) TaxID=573729 RepID=G2Q9Y1_THET4|nr:uncharacterized protein MYCTH_2109081 [Thermothelomyces thermophilus ATCC 42464]AEO56585.1 hypothetical protein MYCTH_2109081 [Thermothelomyces thermophilus ATCC 42464]
MNKKRKTQPVLQFTTGLGPKPVQPDDLSGRTAVVVGGAFGIGFDVLRALTGAGCRVLMDARATIEAESPGGAQVEWHECDMGDLAQVREVFARLREERLRGGTTTGPARLITWLLSAGINTNEFGLDRDGIDRHFGVNFARPVLRRQPAVAAAAQDGQAVRRRSGRTWDSALWALTSDKVQNNGWYYSDQDQPGKESSQASDPNMGAALWDLSHRITREKLGEDALVDWKACAY